MTNKTNPTLVTSMITPPRRPDAPRAEVRRQATAAQRAQWGREWSRERLKAPWTGWAK